MIEFRNSDTWKIQITIAINFISSKDHEKKRVMHSRNKNTKFTSCNDVNKVLDELFDPVRSRYQGNFETSMGGSQFIFDSVQMIYYKCYESILGVVVHILIPRTR